MSQKRANAALPAIAVIGYYRLVTMIKAGSGRAAAALELVEALQKRLAGALEHIAAGHGDVAPLQPATWLRDDGRHGGGSRYAAADTRVFGRASINVSQVHYDDQPSHRLGSATAISTIIHPRHPRAPSFHMHISWTEMRDGDGYWRVMADLNPSLPDPDDTARFSAALSAAAGDLMTTGQAQGDAYFHIPVVGRHRGVFHFYLEEHSTGDFEADARFARSFGEAAVDAYCRILAGALDRAAPATDSERAEQLAYHTIYLLQVLTLDRGTTSGLLVHDQNDVGILGSLPPQVDRARLAALIERMPPPQDRLLRAIVDALPDEHPSSVSDSTRAVLARVVRDHYRAHPEAIDMQASGGIIPPTVANHVEAGVEP